MSLHELAVSGLLLLMDVSLKSALLFVPIGIVLMGMKRASASQRHLVWLLALLALLALPFFSALLPAWKMDSLTGFSLKRAVEGDGRRTVTGKPEGRVPTALHRAGGRGPAPAAKLQVPASFASTQARYRGEAEVVCALWMIGVAPGESRVYIMLEGLTDEKLDIMLKKGETHTHTFRVDGSQIPKF